MRLSKRVIHELWPVAVFVMLAGLVMAPLLRPGFVFALDMVPTPVWRLPEQVTSSYVFYAVMHVLNFVIPGDVLQKLLLLAIFFTMGLGGYKLAAWFQPANRHRAASFGAYLAGLVYVCNPFVYSRFMVGQYAVLMGYALLPWFTRSLLQLLRQPSKRQGVRAGLWLAVVGIASIHTLGLCALLIVSTLVVRSLQLRHDRPALQRLAVAQVTPLGVFLVASSYWLVPLVAGRSTTAQAIGGFGAGDQGAFMTLGGNIAGRLVHLLGLQGFWADSLGLYRLPQAIGPVWWLALASIAALIGLGLWQLWHSQRRLEICIIGGTALIASLLATGLGLGWLSSHVPFFAGYREPQKFAALLALVYAVAAASGAATALRWLHERWQNASYLAAAVIVAVPFLWTPQLAFGGGRQLTTSQYPAGWYAVNARLNQDHDSFKVLFLPWHLYMHFGFSGTIMANPANKFFDKPTLVSNNPEFKGSTPSTPDVTKERVTKLLQAAPQRTDLAAASARLDIKYIIVAHDSDYEDYAYVQNQPNVRVIYQNQTITLYENAAWRHNR